MIELRCVNCAGGPLDESNSRLVCANCGTEFARHRHKEIPVLIGKESTLNAAEIVAMSATPSTPDIGLARRHWATGSLAEYLRASPGRQMLSHGSGDGSDRKWLEAQGYAVTSFDVYPSDFTDYICDGHDLPFADEQFEVVTSIAVLMYLHDPFVAVSEIWRVLKTGGALVGSVGFLEPYDTTYFHMSHLGLTEVLRRAGFRDVQISPGWSFLEALNSNFWVWNRIRALRTVTGAVSRLKYKLGLALWRLAYRLRGSSTPTELPLKFSGSLIFRAVK